MKTCSDIICPASRRDFLRLTASGFGWMALQAMTGNVAAAQNPLAPKAAHFAAKAKRVIFLFMQGAPSHLETFDWKPELAKAGGKRTEDGSAGKGKGGLLMPPAFKFNPAGKSGLMISELFPKLAQHADDLCLLNGMQTSNAAHPQATVALHTGSVNFVRPSMGSWVTYGLGTMNQDLPGFVTINPGGNAGNYGSAFLPATYQGTRIATENKGVPDIRPRLGSAEQRQQIDLIQTMNRRMLAEQPGHPELEGLIESYELASRMQTSVPGVLDLSREPQSVKDMYGITDGGGAGAGKKGKKGGNDFGIQCLMARRMAEAGVRFIQVNHGGWDQHNNLREAIRGNCEDIDGPITALLTDLKQRGMLQDTLVLWGGEFGRTPKAQSAEMNGRQHNNRGYSMWMAGGGVKGGMRYGSTDDLGGTAVAGKMDTHDLHATLLHLLGLDHTKLTYRYAGRDFRLTDVAGKVATGILA